MKRTVVLLSVLVLIAFSYVVAPAADKEVVVTNTSSNAVPISGNVGISGTPNVRVTNTVPVTVGDVVSVMNIDERARVPYFYSLKPTSNYCNQVLVTFPSVPDKKRLRLTNVRALFFMTNADAMLVVHKNYFNPLVAFPLSPFSGAYHGWLLSLNQSVDLIFEAGDSPVLELGSGTCFAEVDANVLGVTGYLIDIP